MKQVSFKAGDWVGPIIPAEASGDDRSIAWTPRFRLFKYGFDKFVALLFMPLLLLVAAALLLVNPFLNPGPVFFRQERMGLDRKPFIMWKFRTMAPADEEVRAHDAPVEQERITPLGAILRRTRVDELPNFINVLKGEMSVIGPRPDAYAHAARFVYTIPYYADRFRVRPGITGLAQVQGGYAETTRAVQRKARFDHFYVKASDIRMDLYIAARTVKVMLTGFGAK